MKEESNVTAQPETVAPTAGILTDEELSKAIAEFLFPWDKTRCGRCGWPLRETLNGGCTVKVCRDVSPERVYVRADAIPDMVRRPDMTLGLLGNMPEPNLWLESEKGEPVLWGCVADIQLGPDEAGFGFSVNEVLGRAVAEAFYLANNLGVKQPSSPAGRQK